MTGPKQKSARIITASALNRFDPVCDYAGQILNELLPQTSERQRATDLVFGTIRNRRAIDAAIAKLADCPTGRIPAESLNIIRIGAYELIYCPQTPEHAIVNEAVENTRSHAGKKQAGFVNAVLRQFTRHIKNRQTPLPDADPTKTLPQTHTTGCEFDTVLLPDPKAAPADYFSIAFSLPKWLVSNWLTEFGEEKMRQICFASNRKPSLYLRPNILKTTAQKLAELFRQADIDAETADNSMIKVKSSQAITQLPGFTEGLFTVQDVTVSHAVRGLNPQPDWTILDLCAAPGTKTTQLAELTGDKATIIATDIDNNRLEKVRENILRLDITSVKITAYENIEKTGPFDCVLLDVPCSNTGVLARRPEVRYRIKPEAIAKLTEIQGRLLQSAAEMLKPKGKICYSTCSIQPVENNLLVSDFLQKNNRLKLESEQLILSSAQQPDHDGGYVAIIS